MHEFAESYAKQRDSHIATAPKPVDETDYVVKLKKKIDGRIQDDTILEF